MAPKTKAETEAGWETVADEEGEPWKPEKEGEFVQGRFEGFTTALDPNGLDGQPRNFNIYKLRDSGGKLRAVYSTYKLDLAFKTIEVGDEVKISYVGKINIGGGQTMNDFQVLRRASTN